MKKKIYKYVSVAVIAVAMVVSFQMSRAESATNLTMENIKALAMADWEISVGDLCLTDGPLVCMYLLPDGSIDYICDGIFEDGSTISYLL